MTRTTLFTALAAGMLSTSLVLAQPTKDPVKPAQPTKEIKPTPAQPAQTKPGSAQPGHAGDKPQLPPGMTEEQMKACMEAGTPGENHQFLAKAAGTWEGKTKMWMAPGTEPQTSTCTATITPVFDGRFVKVEVAGEMPGMGPFNGFGINGYDNVGKTFQSAWIDNCGTGMMTGKGELSSDKKTLTWNYDFNCPIAKGPMKMRSIERYTGPDTMVMEMHAPGPDGKEFKMMEISYTRSGKKTATVPTGH
jgi:hypothetical protein